MEFLCGCYLGPYSRQILSVCLCACTVFCSVVNHRFWCILCTVLCLNDGFPHESLEKKSIFCILGPVQTVPEDGLCKWRFHSENVSNVFGSHTPEEFKYAMINGHFRFVFMENSVRKITQ